MEDGAPPQITQITALLQAHFGDQHVISRGFPTAWPPLSPDINPCDFWLWGFLNHHVNKGNVQTVLQLSKNITCHISSTDRKTLRAIVEHVLNT